MTTQSNDTHATDAKAPEVIAATLLSDLKHAIGSGSVFLPHTYGDAARLAAIAWLNDKEEPRGERAEEPLLIQLLRQDGAPEKLSLGPNDWLDYRFTRSDVVTAIAWLDRHPSRPEGPKAGAPSELPRPWPVGALYYIWDTADGRGCRVALDEDLWASVDSLPAERRSALLAKLIAPDEVGARLARACEERDRLRAEVQRLNELAAKERAEHAEAVEQWRQRLADAEEQLHSSNEAHATVVRVSNERHLLREKVTEQQVELGRVREELGKVRAVLLAESVESVGALAVARHELRSENASLQNELRDERERMAKALELLSWLANVDWVRMASAEQREGMRASCERVLALLQPSAKEGEECPDCYRGVHPGQPGKCSTCKGTGKTLIVETIATVAASLPTSEDDERIVDELMARKTAGRKETLLRPTVESGAEVTPVDDEMLADAAEARGEPLPQGLFAAMVSDEEQPAWPPRRPPAYNYGRLTRAQLYKGYSLHNKLANDEGATARDAQALQDWLTDHCDALLSYADAALVAEENEPAQAAIREPVPQASAAEQPTPLTNEQAQALPVVAPAPVGGGDSVPLPRATKRVGELLRNIRVACKADPGAYKNCDMTELSWEPQAIAQYLDELVTALERRHAREGKANG